MNNDLGSLGSYTRIYVFSGIALLILIVAAINFINLSTAKISGRMKEVGIRKTCGAARSHLMRQFLSESLLITTIAMGLGFVLFLLFKPRLDQYLGKTLSLDLFTTPWILPVIAFLVFAVGLLAGSYPAFFLSRFPAAVIFRSGIPKGLSKSGLRRVLVGAQFFIAITLIICTLVVLKQVRYSENKDLGFNKDNLIVLRNHNAHRLKNTKMLKNQILNMTRAQSVSAVGRFPSAQNRNIATFRSNEQMENEGTIVQSLEVDEDFVSCMELQIVSGRTFGPGRTADKNTVLINEAAAKKFNLSNPPGSYLLRGEDSFQVIGVLKDWNTNSIHSPIYPIVIHLADEMASDLVIRLPSGYNQETIARIRAVWNQFLPGQIFDYSYVEVILLQSYQKERRLATLLISFCQLTVLVACLGIFGLASYSTEQRTKEIGIRKILGASLSGIVVLLTGSYTRWVLLANIFACPAAYFIMKKWLQSFAYRTSVGVGPFFIAGILALMVALLSVIFQTVKAALSNPADSLRYE
jgi:putative ABC transport system permease protein